jgi:hypothetical protein
MIILNKIVNVIGQKKSSNIGVICINQKNVPVCLMAAMTLSELCHGQKAKDGAEIIQKVSKIHKISNACPASLKL